MVILSTFAIFLDSFHFLLGNELKISLKSAYHVKVICYFITCIQRHKSLFLYISKVHASECFKYFFTGVFVS